MQGLKYGVTAGVREHLASGKPITRLEAIVLFGVSNLPDVVSELRKEGWVIKSQTIPFATAVKRVNDYAVLRTPDNLPVTEIVLTEYWVSR